MFLEIPDVLTPAEVAQLRDLARTVNFVDGRQTNPHSTVKKNLQLDYADPAYRTSSSLVLAALQRCEPVFNFAFPRIIAPPLLTKYEPGMTYGWHSDAPFMRVGQQTLRSDLSCTVFLGDPASYDGGELSIQLGTREINFKLPAGGAIVYPSTTIHQVRPVTRGERLAAITFIESRIADQTTREIVYDLNEVSALEGLTMRPEHRVLLDRASNALQRLGGSS